MVSVMALDLGGLGVAAHEVPPSPDRALASRAAAGDIRAFNDLVRLYQRRVFGVALRMLGDRMEAEDVAQEVFVALHGALKGFRAESQLSTWIYRITRNHCLNRIKYLTRRGRKAMSAAASGLAADGSGEDPLSRISSSDPSPARVLETQQDTATLKAALLRLSPEQRDLVVLREVEQLSYEEMADITGLPVGTIKSRLHRARAALLEALPELVKDAP